MPMVRPRARWQSQLTRLASGYSTKAATGTGQSTQVSSGSWDTATSSRARLTAQNAATWPTARRPEGISRDAVRGFRASMSASMMRLSAIARLRAPTMASRIQPSVAALGISMSASSAAERAKGRAKIVCEKRTRPSRAGTSPSPAACGAAPEEVVTAPMLPAPPTPSPRFRPAPCARGAGPVRRGCGRRPGRGGYTAGGGMSCTPCTRDPVASHSQ